MKQSVIFVILILVLLGLALYFLLGGEGGQIVSLEFGRIPEVAVGQAFLVDVSFSNNGDEVLKDARLSLTLPSDVYFVGESFDQRVRERIIGDVGPGSLGKESFNLIVQGETGTKTIETRITYAGASNSKVSFETVKEIDFKIEKPAAAVEIEVPEKVFSGESFDLKIKYRNDSPEELKNLTLKLSYPPIFQFKESSIRPDDGNNTWKKERLGKGEEGEFSVSGSVVGQENSSFSFVATLELGLSGQFYEVTKVTKEAKLSQAPLSLSVLVGGESDHVAQLGETLTYSLVYKNNSGVDLNGMLIRAKMIGEMFDFNTLKTAGSFDSFQKVVIWTNGNVAELEKVQAGGEGQMEIEVKVKDTFPIRRLSDKNYSLKLQVEISSETPVPELSLKRLVSVAEVQSKVAGQVAIDAKGFFRDAPSEILNSGNFPPRLNQITQFTVHWIIKNFATDVDQVKIAANLPAGVRWTGKVKSNGNASPTYEESSRQVVWVVDKIIATKGVISDPLEAIFQVEVVPNSSQVGQVVDFLGETRLQAHDTFADVTLAAADVKLDTNLPDDATVAGSPTTSSRASSRSATWRPRSSCRSCAR